MMQLISLKEASKYIQPGDVIAFSGKGLISWVIKKWTGSNVSHIAIVLRKQPLFGVGQSVEIVESTLLDGFDGVTFNRLGDRLKRYKGSVWWLPLSSSSRKRFDIKRLRYFLHMQMRKKYDWWQAIGSALKIVRNKEDFKRLFCSELVAGAMEYSGVIDNVNVSELTPEDVVKMDLYTRDYYLIHGDVKEMY